MAAQARYHRNLDPAIMPIDVHAAVIAWSPWEERIVVYWTTVALETWLVFGIWQRAETQSEFGFPNRIPVQVQYQETSLCDITLLEGSSQASTQRMLRDRLVWPLARTKPIYAWQPRHLTASFEARYFTAAPHSPPF